MKMALESAVNQLLHEGRSLSFHQLAQLLPKRFSIRDKRVLLAFERLRKEAEDELLAVMHEPAAARRKLFCQPLLNAVAGGQLAIRDGAAARREKTAGTFGQPEPADLHDLCRQLEE